VWQRWEIITGYWYLFVETGQANFQFRRRITGVRASRRRTCVTLPCAARENKGRGGQPPQVHTRCTEAIMPSGSCSPACVKALAC